MKSMSLTWNRRAVVRPDANAMPFTRRNGDRWELSLYYAVVYTVVLPYVACRRLLPASWNASYIGADDTQSGSVFREADLEVQSILGIVFRA